MHAIIRRNRALVPIILLGLLSSCRTGANPMGADQSRPSPAPSPESHAHVLLVNLAVLNPQVAEPLVKGVSAAAMERALGLVVAIGVENARWAEGLLNRSWWMTGESSGVGHEPRAVQEVLSEVRRVGSDAGLAGEKRRKEAREAIAGESGSHPGNDRDPRTGITVGPPDQAGTPGGGSVPDPGSREQRAELEDAVRWVQFTQAWSSYYQAAGVASRGGLSSGSRSEGALDQAVTMSLVRPDFLDRLATLMAAGLGS